MTYVWHGTPGGGRHISSCTHTCRPNSVGSCGTLMARDSPNTRSAVSKSYITAGPGKQHGAHGADSAGRSCRTRGTPNPYTTLNRKKLWTWPYPLGTGYRMQGFGAATCKVIPWPAQPIC